MCVLLILQFILFFRGQRWGKLYQRMTKSEIKSKGKGSVAEPCPTSRKLLPLQKSASLPCPFLHVTSSDLFTGLLNQNSWDLNRGSSVGPPGRKLQGCPCCLGLVTTQTLPGNANEPARTQHVKWVLPRNTAHTDGGQSRGLCFPWFLTGHTPKGGPFTPTLILTNFQNTS